VPLESGDDIENLMPPAKDGSDFKELDLKTTLVDTWKAMIALQKTGKVKSIGVSKWVQSKGQAMCCGSHTPAASRRRTSRASSAPRASCPP